MSKAVREVPWNRFVDAADSVLEGNRGFDSGPLNGRNIGNVYVNVANATGANLDVFSVLNLELPILDPDNSAASISAFDTRSIPAIKGIAPTIVDPYQRVAITQQPILDKLFGVALLLGTTTVKIDITDTGHRFASPIANDATKLTSARSGPARILLSQTGTGEKSSVVQLGEYQPMQLVGKTTSSITARSGVVAGSGTADLYYLDGTTLTSVKDRDGNAVSDETVYNFSTIIATDRYVWLQDDSFGKLWITAEECTA